MKTFLSLCIILLFTSGVQAQTTLVQESFETAGDGGIRYTSNHFETSANEYFKQSGNPVVYTATGAQTFGSPAFPSTILSVNGTQFWAAEGVRGTSATTPDPAKPAGRVTLNGVNVSNYANLKVTVAFADARGPGWSGYATSSVARSTDHLRVQYSFDNVTYTTIGEFSGTNPTTNSDWLKVGGTATDKLTTTLTDYEFAVGNIGATIYVRVEADYSGSNKEIAFDNIRLTGTLSTVAPPTLTGIEGTNLPYAEGALPTQITNSLAVSNPSNTTLSGATVQLQAAVGILSASDVLSFTPGNGISGSYSSTTRTLTLAGVSATANYQAALRTVKYQNTDALNATPGRRTAVFTVADGTRTSATQSRNIDVTASLNPPAPLPYTENFNTDGEGTRYGSNTFSFNSQGFLRVTQATPAASTSTYTGYEGSGYWYAEGTKDNIALGTLQLAPVNATNYHDLHVQVLLGRGGSGNWTIDDYVKLSYNANDGSGWHLFGAFYGVAATGDLRQDANLDGAADATGLALTTALQDVNFTLLPTLTGGSIDFKVDVANNGGEELAFDNIRITGISNRPPVIAAQTFSVAENSANGTQVGIVAASDPDAGQTLTYAITAGNAGNAFAINSTTGRLTVATTAALDFETTPSFALTVQVTDNGNPAMNASNTVTVNLTNVNEAPSVPTDADPAANAVAENAANGTAVGITAAAADPEGTVLAYSLTNDAGGRFAINATTGVVTVANGLLLNYEVNTSHLITVQASDGTLTSSQSFTIQVIDVPNAAYVSSTTEQVTRGLVAGATSQAMLRISVVLNANTDEPLSATSFTFTTAGTTVPADVAVARIYYTGTSGAFATGTPFGSAPAPGSGPVVISGSQVLQPGTNYFWLAYDVAPTAAVGNLLDGTLPALTVGGVSGTPSVTAPAGARPVVAASAVAGTALRLSGTAAGYVDLGADNANLILGQQYTMEVWVKPAATTGTTVMNGVLGNDPGTVGQRSPYISVSETNRVETGFGTGSGTTTASTGNDILVANAWNQVVATYTTPVLSLYINGVLISQTTGGPLPVNTPIRFVGTLTSSATAFFQGDVDEIALWTRALTQNEIRLRRHLVLNGGESGLVGYLQFNEASGNVVDPFSGGSGALTGAGVTRVSSTAPVGTGVSNLQAVNTGNSNAAFAGTGTAISFTGISGAFNVVVARLNGGPQGTPPSGLAKYYNQAYWIINKYDAGSFANAAITYSLNPATSAISAADAANPAGTLRLLKRSSTSDGAFDVPVAAAAASASAGTVLFNLPSFGQTVVGTLGTSPLPVELTAFTATADGPAAVRLAWRTASEKNSASFEVERSADGQTFTPLATMAAAGSSTQPRTYGLLDNQLPAGASTLYYRLRQVDQDGSFSYSPVRSVTLTAQLTGLALFPNPTTHAATLTGTQPGTRVTVFDALGREMTAATVDATGTAALALPAGLPPGVYVVRAGNKALRLTVE